MKTYLKVTLRTTYEAGLNGLRNLQRRDRERGKGYIPIDEEAKKVRVVRVWK